jgi:hypothetical protein
MNDSCGPLAWTRRHRANAHAGGPQRRHPARLFDAFDPCFSSIGSLVHLPSGNATRESTLASPLFMALFAVVFMGE